MAVKPITPTDVIKVVPDEIIEAFNQIIQENWDGHDASFKQKDVVKIILNKFPEGTITKDTIFDKKWLDVEDIYRKSGWSVRYESPDRDESFDEYFTFTKKK